MKFFGKALGLTLAALALSSCGGGGGDGGTFTPVSGTIELSATTTTLPANTAGYLPHQHGPNQAEVTITIRNADGTLMVGHDIQVSISPVQVAALSFLVSDDNDDFDNLWGTFTIKGTNGVATAWVNSSTTTGTATLTASTIDPSTNRTISKSLTFTVTGGVGPAPASVQLTPSSAAVYLPSSGGNNTAQIQATVRDGANQFVPDPASGTDNVQFEIVGTPGDAILSTNSAGGTASGIKVASHTVHGVATVSFQAGEQTPQGPLQIRATVDRADNNVSNGIQDPVTSTSSVIVSDGKLYSIKITSPDTNAILINAVSADATAQDGSVANPDGTYSLTVSALATDRQGNPVLPGTPIRFGSIDEPVGAFNSGATANKFLLAGGDGNPQEGGTTFTAPTGHFTTAGGGAGPGDALVVFGKAQHEGVPQGNEDLESAVTVQRVVSATNLVTASPFNRNDTNGTSVDNGNVLPYFIGRSQHGNITAAATTNDIGVAHATLNYTVSTLGHAVAMWAQGDGIDRVTGGARRVTDAVKLLYPGVAPATLTAFPSPIPGNTTVDDMTVCLRDAMNSPIQGINIAFQMTLGGGSGSVDDNGTSGLLDNATGPDGCVNAVVKTSGMPVSTSDSSSGKIVFSVGDATATVDIVVQLAFLSGVGVVNTCGGTTSEAIISVRAVTTDGSPGSGVAVAASCSGATVSPATATTDATGIAKFSISGTADTTATCTFTAGDVAPLTISVRLAEDDFSPSCNP